MKIKNGSCKDAYESKTNLHGKQNQESQHLHEIGSID